MQDTLTIDSPTPTEPPRRSSGSLKAVNEWWTEFGEVSGSVRSGKLLTPERVETSGLIYLNQLKAKTVGPVMRFAAATPLSLPVSGPAPTPQPEPVASLPQPNALMPVVLAAPARSYGGISAWLTALASVVLVVSVGLIAWQTRRTAPTASPAPQAPPLVAAGGPVRPAVTAPPALAAPGAPAPEAPRVGVAAAPVPVTGEAAPADPVTPERAVHRRSRSDRAADPDAPRAVGATPPTAPSAPASVYDSLAALRPAPSVYDKLASVQPAPAKATAEAPPPRTAAALLQAAVEGKSKVEPAVAALPVTLATAPVLARLRARRGQVTSCLRQFGFLRDTVEVRVTIAGATGRATSVQALGAFAGTPAGRCVERALGGLDFGRFQSASQSVTIPFVSR